MNLFTNMKRKQIDALLIHCYWYDINKKGELDICNRLQVLAASILWRKYDIKNIVLTAGKIKNGKPAIGIELQKQLLLRLPGTAKKSIIEVPTARTTLGEIKKFKKIIDIHGGWQNLSSLGLKAHLPRIKFIFRKVFNKKINNVNFICAENILKDNRHKALVKKYWQSRELQLLLKNESLAQKINNIPLSGLILELIARLLPSKGYLQPKILSWLSQFG